MLTETLLLTDWIVALGLCVNLLFYLIQAVSEFCRRVNQTCIVSDIISSGLICSPLIGFIPWFDGAKFDPQHVFINTSYFYDYTHAYFNSVKNKLYFSFLYLTTETSQNSSASKVGTF